MIIIVKNNIKAFIFGFKRLRFEKILKLLKKYYKIRQDFIYINYININNRCFK